MQIAISQHARKILKKHFDDLNQMAEGTITPGVTTERVEQLVESIIVQLDDEMINIFEEYDETI